MNKPWIRIYIQEVLGRALVEIKEQGIHPSNHPGRKLCVRSNIPNSSGEVPTITIFKRGREGLRGEMSWNNYPKLFPKLKNKWTQEYFFRNKILQRIKI